MALSFRTLSRRALAGASTMCGYGLSVVALAFAALAAIPAMIFADGPRAWAAVAVGQSIGGVAAVIIGYGWGMTGPARIANAPNPSRRAEFIQSLKVKAILAVPAAGAAAGIGYLVVPEYGLHAIVGAVAMSSVGLSANWFFVGVRRPYLQFFLETVPRVSGTAAGILVMYVGSSAVIGVALQLGGMLVAFVVTVLWVLVSFPVGAANAPVARTFIAQGSGLVSTVLSAAYVAAPIAIVTLAAPVALPVFALIDKVQRQIAVGLGPLIVVAQGWVPRGAEGERRLRVTRAVGIALSLGAVLGLVTALGMPLLVRWLSHDVISAPPVVIALAGAFVAVSFCESTVSKAVMPAIERVGAAAKAATASMVIGLPLVALGAALAGTAGALAGVVTGIAVRLGIELVVIRRCLVITGGAPVVLPAHLERQGT